MALDPASFRRQPGEPELTPAPLAGSRSQSMQRLQAGLFGLATMVLLVGLANIILDNAREAEALAVPEAAPTVVPPAIEPAADPLAEAGVVPDTPAVKETPSAPAPTPTIDVPDIEAP